MNPRIVLIWLTDYLAALAGESQLPECAPRGGVPGLVAKLQHGAAPLLMAYFFLFSSSHAHEPGRATAFVPRDNSWTNLTVRQKIGQTMLMLPDRSLELKMGDGSLNKVFDRYPIGGFFMGWKLFDGVPEADRQSHIAKVEHQYQSASRLPLIFQQDYERGVSLPGMTTFPNEMTLGAANSPTLAYDFGKSIALQARSVGVRWVLNPVADLNLNPFNPIVNIRGISDDPDKAIHLLCRQIQGLQDNGVAATIKHFPGDGVDYRDQHLLTSCNSLSLEKWRQYHGKVFQALIDDGVAAIMPGHISFPAYEKEKINGFSPPATLSKELLTDLLKGKMRFKGVIVSDAMVMGGFRGWFSNDMEGQIQSFKAGVDVLLWPDYGYLDEMEKRIKSGEVPMNRLDDAVRRIWVLKERFGILQRNQPAIKTMTTQEAAFTVTTARTICEHAITLVRDKNGVLPLNPTKDKKILLVAVVPISRKGGDGGLENLKLLKTLLEKRGFETDFQHNILYETQGWQESATTNYDRIIFVVVRTPHNPFGPLQLYDDEAQSAWAISAMPQAKVIVVSMGSPYIGTEYCERVDTYINAYSNDETMQEALIKALTGEIRFYGTSPVNLNPKIFTF